MLSRLSSSFMMGLKACRLLGSPWLESSLLSEHLEETWEVLDCGEILFLSSLLAQLYFLEHLEFSSEPAF